MSRATRVNRLRESGWRQFHAGELADAASTCQQWLKLAPAHPDGWFLSGMIALARRNPAEALPALQRAAALAPARGEYQAQLARCLALAAKLPAAVAAARAVLACPDDALALDTAAVVLGRAGEHGQALIAHDRAVQAAPAHPGYRFNRAACLTVLGRFADAEQDYLDCLAARADYWRAWPALVSLRTQVAGEGRRDLLERRLAEAGEEPAAALLLGMALAKVCEDLGDYAAAFHHLSRAKAARRRAMRYRPEDDAALFASIERLFTTPLLPPDDHPPAGPIFVLGMPRSGTTLVERLLAGHPQVSAGGELPDFPLAARRLAGVAGPHAIDEALLEAAASVDPAGLGSAYLDAVHARLGPTHRFTDKLPVNYLMAGLIARALPDARIICLRRDPLDTCVANFRQLFARDFSYYDYSWDLLDIGRYWLLFDGLVRHWQQVLPGRFLVLSYEALVEDPQRETRRLLDFCGLDWHPGCLEFASSNEPVATASAVQVRRGLNREGIGRWRQYEPWLGELRALLASRQC